MTARQRADRLLVERGLFDSRAQAQAAITAGRVRASGVPVRKPSETLAVDVVIEAEREHAYVSRGGVKLAAALDHFAIAVRGRVCLDVGASTGGFTEVLLSRGAPCVYAVDVGSGQLHPRLRGRPEVVSLEQTDIRTLDPARLSEVPDLAVIDVSFISLRHVVGPVGRLLQPAATVVALIKPQFEAERGSVGKGVVRDPAMHAAACEQATMLFVACGWRIGGVMPSPILGGDGNREFFVEAERG